jgi:hypothetical protein
MKKLLLLILLLGLLVLAPLPGYCYYNTVAQRTAEDALNYDSTIQIGLTPDSEAGIATVTVICLGAIAGPGTYHLVLSLSRSRFTYIGAFNSKSDIVAFKRNLDCLNLGATFSDPTTPTPMYSVNSVIFIDDDVKGIVPTITPSEAALLSGTLAFAVVVITATSIAYVWWSSS